MSQPLLFQRYARLAQLPWLSLADLPTPVQPLAIGPGPSWVKRDDLTSPAYGGNKVRKLEFILASARARKAQRLITVGAAGSHHALATATFGHKLGFDTTLVLFPQPLTAHVREVLLTDAALGAELRFTPRMTTVPMAVMGALFAHWRERTYNIAPGGSDRTGVLGYVNAALELGVQIEQSELPAPDLIVLAIGTLGTTAGLAIGLSLLNLPTRIIATRITSRIVTNERALQNLIEETCAGLRHLGVNVSADAALRRITLSHDQVGEGYGRTTPAAENAREVFAGAGLTVDATYTAKAAADFLIARNAQPTAKILFWHTLSATMPLATLPSVDILPTRFRAYLQQ